jgi:TolA-binding protein
MPKAAEVLFNIAGCQQELKQGAAAQKPSSNLLPYPNSEAARKAKKLIATPK